MSSIDLETFIRAAKLLQEKNKDEFHFVLSGDGGYKEQSGTWAKLRDKENKRTDRTVVDRFSFPLPL